MARVEIPAPGDLIMDSAGNVRTGVTVSLKLAGTATDVTHYSALTGGTSTTGGLVSGSDGTIVDGSGNRRYVDAGQTLDLTILSRSRQLEAGSGGSQTAVSPKAHGGDPTGTADASTAISAALATGHPVDLGGPENTWKITSRVDLASGARLIGHGATIDLSSVAITGSYHIGVRAQGTLGSSLSLSANGNKGEFTVTLSSVTGLAVGDWVRLSSGADYPWTSGFKKGEIKRIRTIVGLVVTFEQALYDNYLTADTAVVAEITMVEDVKVDGVRFRGSNTAANFEKGLALEFVNGFSVHDCKFENIDLHSLYVRSSVHGSVTDNDFRGVYYDGVTGSSFYGVIFSGASQWVSMTGGNTGSRLRHLAVTTAEGGDPGCPRFITVDGNVAENMMAGAAGRSWAFEHHGIGEHIVFSNNVADGCYGGFNTRGPGVAFLGNTVRNWYAYALQIHPEIEDCRDIKIADNTVGDRTIDGGGFATPAAVRVQLDAATVIRNVTVEDNILNFDVTTRPAINVDGATISADSFVVKGNTIYHPSASVDSISLAVNGAVRTGNIVNGILEGDDVLESGLSSDVTTMPRQLLATTIGTLTSGVQFAARARCRRGGTFTKIRFCTGTTPPSGTYTDMRAGVWGTDDVKRAETANEFATVTAASTIYTLNLLVPITLKAGEEVYLGMGFIATTMPTVRGLTAAFSGILALTPKLARQRSSWTTGSTLLDMTTDSALAPWVELVP